MQKLIRFGSASQYISQCSREFFFFLTIHLDPHIDTVVQLLLFFFFIYLVKFVQPTVPLGLRPYKNFLIIYIEHLKV